ELKISVDQEKLFAKVTFGSETTLAFDDGESPCSGVLNLAFAEETAFLGCRKETFNVVGKCNVDKELDLSASYIISSNVIQDAYINDNTEWDEEIFMIDCAKEVDGSYTAIPINHIDGDLTRGFYNVRLFNFSVAE